MHERVTDLIESLHLSPHPEGGRYAEIYRSSDEVAPADGRGSRSAVTSIYFLLTRGEHSKWHVVRSDEVWHYYEGDALELLVVDPRSLQLRTLILGPLKRGGAPVQVVPADHWQCARPLGDYTLVGCTVGPGFSFEDFRLVRDDQRAADTIRARLGALTDML